MGAFEFPLARSRAPEKLAIRSLTCLSEASFQTPASFEEHRVPCFQQGKGQGAFLWLLSFVQAKKVTQ